MLAASALGLLLTALPAQGASATTCSTTHPAVAGGYRVVRLTATGVSCTKARTVAATVARQLQRQGGVSVPGVASFSMSTRMCTGCGTTTDVSLGWADGRKVAVSLEKANGPRGPAPVVPTPGPGPLTV